MVTSDAHVVPAVDAQESVTRRSRGWGWTLLAAFRTRLGKLPCGVSYPLVGMLIALSCPSTLVAVLVIASGGTLTMDSALQEIVRTPITFAYLVVWSAVVIAIPSYVLGRLADRARLLSTTDPLTGLFNRRYFAERLAVEVDRARYAARTTCVLYLDLDRLKTINDRAGHAAGDRALIALSRALSKNVRSTDTVARFGGDEFVALLPDTELREGARIAERIAVEIAARGDGAEAPLTVSVGIAVLCATGNSADALAAADAALYLAKAAGGGRSAFGAETQIRSGAGS